MIPKIGQLNDYYDESLNRARIEDLIRKVRFFVKTKNVKETNRQRDQTKVSD